MFVANPRNLAMLSRVLREAYAEASCHSPTSSDADKQDLKERLARLVLDAYTEGETEPDMLKRMVLLRFALQEGVVRH